jgi:hypothetical protein
MVMKTPEEFFAEGLEWMVEAERIAREYEGEETFDKSANLAVLALSSTLLSICALLLHDRQIDYLESSTIQDNEDD